MSLQWLEPMGGPFVVMQERDRLAWLGCYQYTDDVDGADIVLPSGRGLVEGSMDAGDTHYHLGCAVRELCAVIDVDGRQALILADQPAMTTWVGRDDGRGGVFVRWIYANGEDEAERALESMPETGWKDEQTLRVDDAELIIWGSLFPGINGEDDGDSMRFRVAPGSYRIQTQDFQPDEQTFLRLHRLIPA